MMSNALGEGGLSTVPDSVSDDAIVSVDDVEGPGVFGFEIRDTTGVLPRRLLGEQNPEAFIVRMPPFFVQPTSANAVSPSSEHRTPSTSKRMSTPSCPGPLQQANGMPSGPGRCWGSSGWPSQSPCRWEGR